MLLMVYNKIVSMVGPYSCLKLNYLAPHGVSITSKIQILLSYCNYWIKNKNLAVLKLIVKIVMSVACLETTKNSMGTSHY